MIIMKTSCDKCMAHYTYDELHRCDIRKIHHNENDCNNKNPIDEQVGGNHYKYFKIQPVEFIHKNNIGFMEGNAIKYLCRYKSKGGIEDLKKAKHYIEMLIEMEGQKDAP